MSAPGTLILVLVALAVCVACTGVGAADEVNVAPAGHFDGATGVVATSGNYAYLGQGPDTAVSDTSDPAASSGNPGIRGKNITLGIKSANGASASGVYRVTLITGDVILVRLHENGNNEINILPTEQGGSKSFKTMETPKGTYIFPDDIDLRKLDIELFNINYLIEENYYNETDLPVLIDYAEAKRERRLDVPELRASFENEADIAVMKSYHSTPTFSAKISYKEIDKTFETLTGRPDVKKIWLDKKVKATLYGSVPLIGTTELWESGYDGSGIEIAILDTGIDENHPDLDDLDDDPSTNDPKVIRKKDFTDDFATDDLCGHGTHCAGIAAGTGNAPTSTLAHLGNSGSGGDTHPPSQSTVTPTSTSSLAHEDSFKHPLYGHTSDSWNEPAFDLVSENTSIVTLAHDSLPYEHLEQDVKNMEYSATETSPDSYEPDDEYMQASWISVNGLKQTHNFHISGDQDYVTFDANENINYLIETSDLGIESDTYIYLYGTDGVTEITRDDDGGYDLASRIVWRCGVSGTYTVKIRHYSSSAYGPDTYYNISVFEGYTTPAEFSDVYADYGEDTNEDGLYDRLTIDVRVNVTEAGNYGVCGYLDDNTGYPVDYASTTSYLSAGSRTVQLNFEGMKIRRNEVNGPYNLQSLYLYDSSTGDQLDYVYDAHTTSYYSYTDFQEFPRYTGVAPSAELWNVKVLNQYGQGYDSWIIAGIEYAAYGPDGIPHTGDEADIISMSLGGGPTDGTDPLSQAVNDAVDHGLVVVVAAGNSGPDYFTVSSPGAASDVITVGASTKYDELAWFSSCGPTLDMRVKPDVLARVST